MPDLATAAIADLHAWHEQQNPLVRALTQPLTARVAETLTAMQAALDAEVGQREALLARSPRTRRPPPSTRCPCRSPRTASISSSA